MIDLGNFPSGVRHSAHAQNARACAQNKIRLKRGVVANDKRMASKSFTALPSVVSVAAERTYVALRCNKRGFEKVTWPVVAIVLTALSFALFAVAAGTEAWTTVRG